MAKKPNINVIATGYQATDTINNNFTNVRDSFDNTLSRDGSTPNAMEADLDLNSNDILNVNQITANEFIIAGYGSITQGPTGPTGSLGPTGATGPAGAGVTYKGSVADSLLLPGYPSSYTGLVGDAYVTTDDNHFWVWDGTNWIDNGPITYPLLGMGWNKLDR